MAISGTFYGATGNAWIKPRIQWTAQANIEGNYSDVTATLSYTRTNSGYTTYGYWAGSLTINGDTKYASGVYVEITENGYTATVTHTVRVPHADDGTKTIHISATGGISGTTLTDTSISGDVNMETIPRAASIAATDADIGAVSVVTIGKKSDLYTHTVAYRFGSLSGYLTANGLSDTAVKLTQGSLSFTLPDDFYYQIPNAPTGVCTLTCTTYLGDTAVGSPQQTSFTVRANPEKCGPVLTAQVADTNSVTVALTGSAAKAVRYASNMQCSLSSQGRFGASITEKTVAGKTVTGTTLLLTGIENGTIRFWVRDSRGYVAETVLSPELIPYKSPTGKLTVARTDATSGNADLQVQGSWFSGSFGAKKNALSIRYRIDSGNWQTLSASLDGDSYNASTQLADLAYTDAYLITLEVSDCIHTVSFSARINPGIPVFDWGKEDFQFNVPVILGNGSDILRNGSSAFAPAGYGLGKNICTIPANSVATFAYSQSRHVSLFSCRGNLGTTFGTFLFSGYGVGGNGRVCVTRLNGGESVLFGITPESSNGPGVTIWNTSNNELRVNVLGLVGNLPVATVGADGGATQEPFEYENPPMALGVEYRTTERYLGKTVYAKCISFGALPNATYKELTLGVGATNIVRCYGVMSNGLAIPYDYVTTAWKEHAYLTASTSKVTISCDLDLSAYSANIIVYYAKN